MKKLENSRVPEEIALEAAELTQNEILRREEKRGKPFASKGGAKKKSFSPKKSFGKYQR